MTDKPQSSPQSRSERQNVRKSVRGQVPRSSHGAWPPRDRPDPIDLLGAQYEGRLQHLLPIKDGLARFLPIVSWMRNSDRAWLKNDLIAGLSVAYAHGVDLHLSRVKPQVMDILQRDGVIDIIGADHIHDGISAAVAMHLKKYPTERKDFQDLQDLIDQAKSQRSENV